MHRRYAAKDNCTEGVGSDKGEDSAAERSEHANRELSEWEAGRGVVGVNDSMTMSAPKPEQTLVVRTNQGPGERSRG